MIELMYEADLIPKNSFHFIEFMKHCFTYSDPTNNFSKTINHYGIIKGILGLMAVCPVYDKETETVLLEGLVKADPSILLLRNI